MININKILNSATMGHPEKLRPMILWTMLEYFFRGAPYGALILVVWELFKPLENPGTFLNIANIILAFLFLFVSLVILYFVSRKSYLVSYRNGYQICSDGRLSVIDHLYRLPMSFYNSRDPGDIAAYIANDYTNVEMLTTHFIGQFFGGISMPIVALVCLAFFNWQLALVATIVIPIAFPTTLLTHYLVTKTGRKHHDAKNKANSRMIEYIQGIRLIKSFNLVGSKFTRLDHALSRLKRESIRLEVIPGASASLTSILLNGGLILIIVLGFSLLLQVKVSIPVYVMFLLMGGAIYAPLINGLSFLHIINYLNISAIRINKLIETPVLPEGEETQVLHHTIEFKNVNFSYNADIPVLHNVSLTIPEKSLVAFVGPSGSGKTTLTRLIARFWDTDSGQILLGGKDVRDYTVHTLMQQISIVFQDVYLFNDTVYNNIRIGRESATREEIEEVAKKAQCHQFIMNLPQGYDTMVGEGGSTLSGGEKQRISIARAMLKNAPIVLLDEATASIDAENEWHIHNAIDDLVKDRTVVIIAHKLSSIINADKIIVLENGHIVQQGLHKELIEQDGVYSKLWHEQEQIKGWKF